MIIPSSDSRRFDTLQKIRKKFATFGRIVVRSSLIIAIAAACRAPEPPAAATTEPAAVAHACAEQGHLSATLYGAIDATLAWTGADLECDGMPRPDDAGARLRFAAIDGERSLAIIIAIPELRRGTTGSELASNVTLIEEGSGRFFNNADLGNCWTDVTLLEPSDDSGARFEIGGTLYCVSPLAEINGDTSISIPELDFRGRLDWESS